MKFNLDQDLPRAQEAELPDCYDGPNLRFIVIDDQYMIAVNSDHAPLRINRWDGEVTELSCEERSQLEFSWPYLPATSTY